MNLPQSDRSTDPRTDFEERIALRSDERGRIEIPVLESPATLVASSATGHVLLRWSAVDGAVGYLVHRRIAGTHDAFAAVDHEGRDVLSVPDTWYVDTTGETGVEYEYAVATTSEVTVHGPIGSAARATALVRQAVPLVVVDLDVRGDGAPLDRPWRPMVGSERLSQLLDHGLSGGRDIGAEHLDALRRINAEVGVEQVRAHAIFHDDLGVYREVDGRPVHDFSRVDEVYDLVRSVGMRPVVELGFMPRDLASDRSKSAFSYQGYISPPTDEGRWSDLVTAFVAHLVDRYGIDDVLVWDFEVWNEANLEVFWSGTRDEWMRLYDVTAAAVRAVDGRLKVGGPSSAAAGWVDDLLAHARESGAPVDFVTTHTYGNAPLDVRPTLERFGYGDARILWTEWGVTPTHFNPVNDTVSSATFLLSGMRSAAGRVDALSYWVVTDHFEELGRPASLLHGGFGLISIGGIAKPRYHALWLLARLADVELPVSITGDGAGLVQAWASRAADGAASVLVWNHTLDQGKSAGDPALHRTVDVRVSGGSGATSAVVWRLDDSHGNLAAVAAQIGVSEWPEEEQWDALRTADRIVPEIVDVERDGDDVVVRLELPQPGAVLIEFSA